MWRDVPYQRAEGLTEEDTDILQTIPHPATSIWSCTVVPSGKGNGTYIASSANDGQIRFFTKDPALAAKGAVKEGWDQEVSSRQLDK
jgi:phospholipase A-2-activating protein